MCECSTREWEKARPVDTTGFPCPRVRFSNFILKFTFPVHSSCKTQFDPCYITTGHSPNAHSPPP